MCVGGGGADACGVWDVNQRVPSDYSDLILSELIRSGHAHSIEAMQLCCLLLTQQSRLKLHHVLCFVNEASTNPKLRLSKDQPNLSVLLEQFCPVVMRRSSRRGHHVESSGMRDDLCTLLTFMAEHCHSIMKVRKWPLLLGHAHF